MKRIRTELENIVTKLETNIGEILAVKDAHKTAVRVIIYIGIMSMITLAILTTTIYCII